MLFRSVFRIEIVYYGLMYNPNSNNFVFTPFFEQLSCATVAVDYISAEVESVCMDKGAVCVGESESVNAAGFPRDALYLWEIQNSDSSWSVLEINGEDIYLFRRK